MWSTALHYGSERAISQVPARCGGSCRCWLCRSFKPLPENKKGRKNARGREPTFPYWQYIEPVTSTSTPLQHRCSSSQHLVWSRFTCTLLHCVFYSNNDTLNICLLPLQMSYHGTMHVWKRFLHEKEKHKQEKANGLFTLKHVYTLQRS